MTDTNISLEEEKKLIDATLMPADAEPLEGEEEEIADQTPEVDEE